MKKAVSVRVGMLLTAITIMGGISQRQVSAAPPKLVKVPLVKGPIIKGPIVNILLNPDGAMLKAGNLDDFFNAMPGWSSDGRSRDGRMTTVKKPDGEKQKGATENGQTQEGNRDYNTVTKHYSLTETPNEIVSFDPSTSVFYPGSLLQETGMRSGLGSLRPLPGLEGKRAPLKVYVRDGSQRLVADPDSADISTAVKELRAEMEGKAMSTSTNFDYSFSASAQQSALKLGLDAFYMTASVKAVLDTRAKANEESVNGTFTLKAYTIGIQPTAAGWRGFFNNKFTLDDARGLVNQKAMGAKNLPCYVDSVTYGTIIVFNMTRQYSEQETQSRMEAHMNNMTYGVNASVAAEDLKKNENVMVKFTTIGGPSGNAYGAVQTVSKKEFDNILSQLTARPPSSLELAPISYTVRALKDGTLASMQRTTDYTYTEYAPNPAGEKFSVRMYFKVKDSGDGVADNDVECFGELRLNGEKIGDLPRAQAPFSGVLEKNGTLEIGRGNSYQKQDPVDFQYYYQQKKNMVIDAMLKDKDDGSKDDFLGQWHLDFDPAKYADKGDVTFSAPKIDNKVKAELHVIVTRTGYL